VPVPVRNKPVDRRDLCQAGDAHAGQCDRDATAVFVGVASTPEPFVDQSGKEPGEEPASSIPLNSICVCTYFAVRYVQVQAYGA